MMTKPSLLELAKQGNPKAIATLITRSLQAQGVTAKAGIKGDCLRVMLEAKQLPNEQALVQYIRQGLTKLQIASIKTVRVSGKQVGKEFPAWIQDFKLVVNSQTITEASSKNGAKKTNLSADKGSSLTVKDSAIPKTSEENEQELIKPLGKSSFITTLKSPSYLSSLFSLKAVYRVLVALLLLRISFDILFVFYSVTWATSYLVIKLLDTVDTTGVLAYVLYFLFNLIHWLWFPIELAGNWIYLITLIAVLVWLHRLHAKLKVLFSGYPITPWGAIARFLIPLYSLWGVWNLFATLANKLKAEGDDLVSTGASLQRWLPWLYVALLASNILEQVYSFQSKAGYRSEISPWLFVITNTMNLFFSIIFLQMVKLVRKAVVNKSLQLSGQQS